MDRKTKFGLMITAMLVTACVPEPWRAEQDQKAKAYLAPYIGRPVWTANGKFFEVCPQLIQHLDCRPGAGRLTVDSYESEGAKFLLHVTFEGGPSGYVSLFPDELPVFLQDHSPLRDPDAYPSFILNPKDRKSAQVAAARRDLPGVILGMSQAEVRRSAWGEPESVKSRSSARHFDEWWVYPQNNIIHFRDGIVVEIDKL